MKNIALTFIFFITIGAVASSVTIQWNPSDFATGYNVYRAIGLANNSFELWKTTALSTSFTVPNTATEPWKVYVTATNGIPGISTLEESLPSNQIQINPRPKAPALSIISTTGSATIQWSSVEFASGYRVYRSIGTNTLFDIWKNTTSLSFVVTNTVSDPWKIYVVATNGIPDTSSMELSDPSNQVQINVRPKAVNTTVFSLP